MLKKLSLVSLFLLVTSSALLGQGSGSVKAKKDTLNKYNSKKLKNGYWKVFLDDKVNPTDSLKNAYFYGFELWDNGEYVFKYFNKNWKYSKVVFEGALPEKGKPEPINGKFKWYDSDSVLINEEEYKNGHPFFIKSYKKLKDGTTHPFEVLYFDKKLNNIPGTYYYEEYYAKGTAFDKYWYRKGKKGWRVYLIK